MGLSQKRGPAPLWCFTASTSVQVCNHKGLCCGILCKPLHLPETPLSQL